MSMSVNTNKVMSLQSQRSLLHASQAKNSAMAKLSSGLKINKGADSPAGLVISELLRSQISGYQQSLRNTQESSNVMAIAEGGLSSVSSMLTQMRGLAIQSLNSGVTSSASTNANQMQMNSLLSSVNRVVSTTNYGGKNLLDGSQSFTFQTNDPSGLLDASGSSISNMSSVAAGVNVAFEGGSSAQAEKAHLEADFGGSTLGTAQEFTVTGASGAQTFSFAAGTSVEDMAAQINASASSTGVNAYAIRDQGTGATSIRLASEEYGSNASVKVEQRTGDGFAQAGGTAVDYGQDASVSVNGQSITTQGLTANVATSGLNATVKFQVGDAGNTTIAQTGYDQDELVDATAGKSARMTNVKGGMQLQLGGGGGESDRQTVSLGDFNSAALGQVSVDGKTYSINDLFGGGEASLANNPELALKVIDQAISDVASGRANIGAYQANALDTNANNMMVAIENTTATESSIRDTDMAEAMSLFIQSKLMEQAGLKSMQFANMRNDHVSTLLGINSR